MYFHFSFGESAELFAVSTSKYPEIDRLLYYGKKDDKYKAYNLTMELNNKVRLERQVVAVISHNITHRICVLGSR